VGQGDQLGRNAVLVERLVDVCGPVAGADQAGAELVRLAQLEADPAGGAVQGGVGGSLRPAAQHPRLEVAQVLALALAEAMQCGPVALLDLLDLALAGASAQALREADHLVDDAEILGVVDQPAPAVDLGVDPRPEADVRLQGVGARQERSVVRRPAGRGDAQRRQGGESDESSLEHGCSTDRQHELET
jgi:hypothetical protein